MVSINRSERFALLYSLSSAPFLSPFLTRFVSSFESEAESACEAAVNQAFNISPQLDEVVAALVSLRLSQKKNSEAASALQSIVPKIRSLIEKYHALTIKDEFTENVEYEALIKGKLFDFIFSLLSFFDIVKSTEKNSIFNCS